jgi:hypothetical protein
MSTAEERKKAKQEYMAALDQQRQLTTETQKSKPLEAGDTSERNSKMTNRERMLEERRQKFLDKKTQGQPDSHKSKQAPKNPFAEMFDERNKSVTSPRQDFLRDEARNERRAAPVAPVPDPYSDVPSRANPLKSADPFDVPERDPFGGPSTQQLQDDKAMKKAKQAEYARELENQMHHGDKHHHHQPQQGYGRGGNDERQEQSNPFGGPSTQQLQDEKALKKAKQAEYARQLENQMHQPPIGGQQQQYQQPQQQHQQQPQQGYGRGSNYEPSSNPFGGPSTEQLQDEKALKKAKQAEYARQLENQMHQPPIGGQQQQYQQPQQQHQQQPQQGYGRGSNYEPSSNPFGGPSTQEIDDKKARKKAQQAEYARQLENQMSQKGSDHRDRNLGGRGGRQGHNESARDTPPALGEGWIMGPLGVPVREVLAVGNRQLQKEYAQSPQKPTQRGMPQRMMNQPFGDINTAGYGNQPVDGFQQYPDPGFHQHMQQQPYHDAGG